MSPRGKRRSPVIHIRPFPRPMVLRPVSVGSPPHPPIGRPRRPPPSLLFPPPFPVPRFLFFFPLSWSVVLLGYNDFAPFY